MAVYIMDSREPYERITSPAPAPPEAEHIPPPAAEAEPPASDES